MFGSGAQIGLIFTCSIVKQILQVVQRVNTIFCVGEVGALTQALAAQQIGIVAVQTAELSTAGSGLFFHWNSYKKSIKR